MSDLNLVGERDGWRCWLCDKAIDPEASVNSDLGPSVDSYFEAKAKQPNRQRLAHRACNTMRGKVLPVIPWSKELFLVDPSPILESVERLVAKGGKEVMARTPTEDDAHQAASWLIDRLARLVPETTFATEVVPGGGMFLIKLRLA